MELGSIPSIAIEIRKSEAVAGGIVRVGDNTNKGERAKTCSNTNNN